MRRPFRSSTRVDDCLPHRTALGRPGLERRRCGALGDFGQLAPEDSNILHWMLTDPAVRHIFGETWAEEARRIVSLFRAAYDPWPGDMAFAALVDRIRASCLEFDAWWSEHGVGAPVSGAKHLRHPTLGVMGYEYASFQANDDPALSRPSTPGAEEAWPARLPVALAAFYHTRRSG
jgi:hypothetical protein